jgi:hypothetical protein
VARAHDARRKNAQCGETLPSKRQNLHEPTVMLRE